MYGNEQQYSIIRGRLSFHVTKSVIRFFDLFFPIETASETLTGVETAKENGCSETVDVIAKAGASGCDCENLCECAIDKTVSKFFHRMGSDTAERLKRKTG
jgi:hypothetical protein